MRAIAAIENTAWCALMNRKTRTLSCRSPVRTRPPLLPGARGRHAAGGSHGADGLTQSAPPPEAHHRGGQHHVRLGARNSRSLAPLARTRVTAPPAFGLIAPARPSGAEIPARMAGDSSASQHLLLKWKGVHETGSTPGADVERDGVVALSPFRLRPATRDRKSGAHMTQPWRQGGSHPRSLRSALR